ncbi:MAG: Asp-tRNA(Asn)/Glu-tRNA(Gln) amidotransferase subunit GatA [Candidatus Pacebacteria bacterium]|nr:Asp-tRNA(Asn)/Glu-tRNA(Gln) amidotransferase subunit GatA [Candidatus Paceibacterota bacterium]PIR60988.1 MAG: Asp-tRNA(Asn)/Glu-tRNA(Gln) amidotransferase subunit GatA [Candidatus Pacebacteria bacterium CG10_big_fil_rev_8_21_14_0_10_45_6]
MKNNLHKLTLKKALAQIQSGETTAKKIYADCFSQIEAGNKDLNVFLSTNSPTSMKQFENPETTLQNCPIAVKDNICIENEVTTAASTVLEDYKPAYSATLIDNLKLHGGAVIGKTNLDAWAHGSSTETSQFGRTLNPRNPKYLPGGSSGGSAAAVAADMCTAAIGTETAGSIRQPASWCGVVGLKPTYGRVSRYGVIAMASSTDSPGPITKTVEDAAIMLACLAGHDSKDGTTTNQAVPDYVSLLQKSISGLKIGIMYQDIPGLKIANPYVLAAAKVLESLGAKVELVNALDPKYAVSVYTIVQRAEVSSNLARFDGIRFGNDRSYFGDEARRRILLGTHTLRKGYAEKYYQVAQKTRTLFIEDFSRLFSSYDVLISPTSPSFAEPIGASEDSVMFGELADMLLEPSSIAGLPGISVPCFHDEKTNLYLGLNIMAPAWREDLVLQVAHAYEINTDWNSWRKDNND